MATFVRKGACAQVTRRRRRRRSRKCFGGPRRPARLANAARPRRREFGRPGPGPRAPTGAPRIFRPVPTRRSAARTRLQRDAGRRPFGRHPMSGRCSRRSAAEPRRCAQRTVGDYRNAAGKPSLPDRVGAASARLIGSAVGGRQAAQSAARRPGNFVAGGEGLLNHPDIEAAGLSPIVRHSGLEEMADKSPPHSPMNPGHPGIFDHGRASKMPCPTNATSPPTFTVSTRSAVPSGSTRNLLGRPVNWPWFRMKVSPPRTSP